MVVPVPAITDAGRRAYLAEVAALMDARQDRIGEHAAQHALPWAITALGPVPDDPQDRAEWQRRAASIGAWRELSGHRDPADPIGPEPVAAAPDLRASWHQALAALGPTDGPDVRGLPDGKLLHLRDTYPMETAWAPQYVGDELRQVRAAASKARLVGLRAAAEATAAKESRRPRHRRPPAGTRGKLSRPCTGPTGSARPYSPRPWSTAPTGKPPPAPSATWLSPPTSNSAAVTRTSTTRRSAPPNPTPSPTASAPSHPLPGAPAGRDEPVDHRPDRRRTAPSPSGSPTGRA